MTGARCTATARIYSGRPDPEWSLDAEHFTTLRRLWQGLSPATSAPRSAPPLGYRGATVRCGSEDRWSAYRGVVTFQRGSAKPEHREDPGRRFEHAVLATAPADTLPPEILASL
ncbi:MAG TPA: hypothetical protein VID28_11585 [Methylomirabilota bacterium]|jgi:hypothetical protein